MTKIKISLFYDFPEGYDISSIVQQFNGEGEHATWIVWVCQHNPDPYSRARTIFHGRGEAETLPEATAIAIQDSERKQKLLGKFLAEEKLEDLF